MDRTTVYYGQLARETDVLLSGQRAMIALGKLAEATIGSGTSVDGFTCVPTAPASLAVSLTAGQVFQVENIEASAWSSLGQDTRSILKQAIMLDAVSLTLVAPTTAGYAQNVLIEVQYQDLDDGNTVLPYYNAGNPSVPFNGPANNGQAQATARRGVVAIQAKYGIAATSGTQVTPTADAGWAPLYVVTLAFGQTSITAGSIVKSALAPFLAGKLSTIPAFVLKGLVQQVAPFPVIYVRTDGSDANDGTSNDPAHAFLTLDAAIAQGIKAYALAGSTLTIQLGNAGTYAAPVGTLTPSGKILIQGDGGNPGSFAISGAGPGAGGGVLQFFGGNIVLNGLTLVNTSASNSTLYSGGNAAISVTNTRFVMSTTTNTGAHVFAAPGSSVTISTGCSFLSNAGYMLLASGGSVSINAVPVTLANTPAFSGATVAALNGGQIQAGAGASFTGTGATGVRYSANLGGIINSSGQGANFFPGSTAGTANTSLGGYYA